ncbi:MULTISPECIES: sodium:solute symporter family protein [Gordonibacter]|uniref:Sodium:solute symporter family protein n=1 Tax=Gordonibacter faecis TaxID=3047475 RepID=A0ABT7DQL7_9ACTN|nr:MULTISPECIES: sodium:solute symporter family protein [unclassified Gordonibacter]MDJ1651829.1 sodium:solute symporter family protein [Gordonibacter sp. KGMB12511]HIW75638.1 sodium:solute symporter family protein [Candidatus Gordonibacter avicola]
MSLPFIMLVAYIVVTVLIGIAVAVRGARREKASSAQFLTAQGNLAWFMVIPLLFAEMMAGAATIGKAATGYTTGLSAVWVNWGMSIGMIVFIVFAARFYRAMNRKYGILSVPEAFKFMFDQRCRTIMLIIIVVVYCFLYSSQPISAAALIAPMIGLDVTLVAWVVSALFIVVTLLGGMKGLALMNIVHMVVMYAGLIAATSGGLDMVGGLGALYEQLPASYFDLLQPDIWSTLANALGIGISFLAAATMVTATISARSPRDMAIGAWGAAAIVIPFATLPAIIGMCAAIALPGIDPNTALFAMSNAQGPAISGVVSMAIAAAIWSSAPAALLFISNTLTQDLYAVVRPQSTDCQRLVFSRLMVVLLGIVATWLGLNASSILGQLYAAFQIRSVVGIVLLVAMVWPRVTSGAAFWSMLGGGLVAAVWHFAANPFGVEPLWPACAVTIVVLVGITLASKEKVSEGYKRYRVARDELAASEGRSVKKTA